MKKVISVFMTLLALFILTSVPSYGEALYVRKIVSVVYDDSGSMKGKKWAYANYAMQSFCGMLNSEDRLFITYMSKVQKDPGFEPEEADLSSAGIQGSVDGIKNHSDKGATPFDAVETAYRKLQSTADSDPDTEYWLVVITDGEFNNSGLFTRYDKSFLNKRFSEFSEGVMPNGTRPKITFLGIGEELVSPDENTVKDIYTYSASDAAGITNAMGTMVDRISGRTRLPESSVSESGDREITVSSTVPLLNIAIFTQNTAASIVKAECGGNDIPVSRSARLGYSGAVSLSGGAFLLGSSGIIDAGTYKITFDSEIEKENVIVLFEPALEIRMKLFSGDSENFDTSKLSEGNQLSAECKIYEMGTTKEIDPSLLPDGSKISIEVFENGSKVQGAEGEEMKLPPYELKNIDTEVRASLIIKGFNPITASEKFRPAEHRITYAVTPSYPGGKKSIKLSDVGKAGELSLCFTVTADGNLITDPEEIKKINPVISLSPEGNGGKTEIKDTGEIIFTPDRAGGYEADASSCDVSVICTLDDGTEGRGVYTVLIADYKVISLPPAESIVKTEFFGNRTGASFYITKDGEKLDKTALGEDFTAELSSGDKLKSQVSVSDDGTVSVIPFSEEEYKLDFFRWFINWAGYFSLPGRDIKVSFSHRYGTGEAVIDVKGESIVYQIFCVYLPLVLEIIALVLFITWIILVITKPRYMKGAKLCCGKIFYEPHSGCHSIMNLKSEELSYYNKIKKGHGRLKFKRKADTVYIGGIKIRAEKGGVISCENEFPWYKGMIKPRDPLLRMDTAKEQLDYFSKGHSSLEIEEISAIDAVNSELLRRMTPANNAFPEYWIVPARGSGIQTVEGREVISSGYIFIYLG